MPAPARDVPIAFRLSAWSSSQIVLFLLVRAGLVAA